MIAIAAEMPQAARASGVCVRRLGRTDYEPTWRAMQDFTARRGADAVDELWLTEHNPVYTLGLAGRSAHLPRSNAGIPVIKSDRGGQITYHGPGQLVAYVLLDMRRRALTVRPLVRIMEQAVIDLIGAHGIDAERVVAAPGVYVNGAKVAALGLRVRNGCCYHGLAVNVDMDLTPFHAIDPCGYPGLRVTQLRELGIFESLDVLGSKLADNLLHALS